MTTNLPAHAEALMKAAFGGASRSNVWKSVARENTLKVIERLGASGYEIVETAEIERLRERVMVLEKCLNKYAKADVTCSYVHLESRSYDVYEHCETWAQKALAGKDGAE